MIEIPALSQAMLDEPALLAQRHHLGRLRFSSPLESGFQDYMHRKMCGRLWPVMLSSLGFMLLFFWVDYRYLPPEIYNLSIPLRTLVLVLVCFCLWFVNRPGRVAVPLAFNMATLAYFCVGAMVATIILLCRSQPLGGPVTHDGLYLVLLSGTFLLGLPARHSVLCSWAILICYLTGEVLVGTPRELILNSSLYLCSFT